MSATFHDTLHTCMAGAHMGMHLDYLGISSPTLAIAATAVLILCVSEGSHGLARLQWVAGSIRERGLVRLQEDRHGWRRASLQEQGSSEICYMVRHRQVVSHDTRESTRDFTAHRGHRSTDCEQEWITCM